MCLALPAGNAVLNGSRVLLKLRQNENLDLQIHIRRGGDRSCGDLGEDLLGVTGIVGSGDTGIEHRHIDCVVPLASDPSRMNRSRDRI